VPISTPLKLEVCAEGAPMKKSNKHRAFGRLLAELVQNGHMATLPSSVQEECFRRTLETLRPSLLKTMEPQGHMKLPDQASIDRFRALCQEEIPGEDSRAKLDTFLLEISLLVPRTTILVVGYEAGFLLGTNAAATAAGRVLTRPASKARQGTMELSSRILAFLVGLARANGVPADYHAVRYWMSKQCSDGRARRYPFEGGELEMTFDDCGGKGVSLPARRGFKRLVAHDFVLNFSATSPENSPRRGYITSGQIKRTLKHLPISRNCEPISSK